MNHLTLIAKLIERLNQNQLELGVAIDELSHWIELGGSVEVAANVRDALMDLDVNFLFVRQGIADLIAAGAIENGAASNDTPI